MTLFRLLLIGLAAPASVALAEPTPAPSSAPVPAGPALDFDFFKARIQPIFTTKRPGHARCVSCHASGTTMKLQPLPQGLGTWSDADSRKNFDTVRLRVKPGNPDASRLLRHPLAAEAGGDPHHDGGKHWASKSDPEWQTLASWVRGATLANPGASAPGPLHPRIIQSNSGGDEVHIIDPATNKVVGRITGIEVNHGVAGAPDGSRIYVSDEADSTLDVVDSRTLRVISKVPLSGHPNNISISRDGARVYVAIAEGAGAVDVIDTQALQRAKSIPIKGRVHNTYVTPDGRYVLAGSIAGKSVTVIDQKTEEPLWVMDFDKGVRPLAFDTNPDGSTRHMFVQLSDFNGFVVVDFATHKELQRIALPKLGPGKKEVLEGGSESHGMAVTPDNSRMIVNSRLNSAVYIYALPDMKLLGSVDVGVSPDWVTLTPDGKAAYVANATSNNVSVIDMMGLREITRIPVGQVPKRNTTAMLP
ncbi:MAG TPA: beta-propeller fold lactonase family protein [Caulobacteraceae bacterium]|nr:beta-propeller fold lactonase family protein [Caulobacteraceae bacterium]